MITMSMIKVSLRGHMGLHEGLQGLHKISRCFYTYRVAQKECNTLIVISRTSSIKQICVFILLGRKFIFKQNDTMTINFG